MRASIGAVAAAALFLVCGLSARAIAGDAVCCTNFLSSPGNPLSCDNLETYLPRKDLLQFCKNVRDTPPGVCPAKDKSCHDNCAALKAELKLVTLSEDQAWKAKNDYADDYYKRHNALVNEINRERRQLSDLQTVMYREQVRIQQLKQVDEHLRDLPETPVRWQDPFDNKLYSFTKENRPEIKGVITGLSDLVRENKEQQSVWDAELKKLLEVDIPAIADEEANGIGKETREALVRLTEARKRAQTAYDNCSPTQ